MKTTYGNEGAFAAPESGTENYTTQAFQKGLTKREYFAIHILGSMSVNYGTMTAGSQYSELAARSIKLADALLKELESPVTE